MFTHGQLYVAISIVKSKKGLKILILDDDGNTTNSTTNVVYREIFENIFTTILIRYENSLIQNYFYFSYFSSNISSNIAKVN